MRQLPPSALTRRVDQLLNFELELTGRASMLAFRPNDSHWDALAAGFGDHLGAPGDELRRLAATVASPVIDGDGYRPAGRN